MRSAATHRFLAAVVGLAALFTIVGSFAPWVRTGATQRNSFDAFGIVERLGFSPHGPVGLAVRMWPVVPLMAVGTTVLVAWGRRGIGALAGVATGAYVGTVGVAMLTAPQADRIDLRAGVPICAVAGWALVAAVVPAWWVGRAPGALRRPTAPDRAAPPSAPQVGRS